jgi:hypothetical protein
MGKIRLHITSQERLVSGHESRYFFIARRSAVGIRTGSSESLSHSHFIFLVRSLAEPMAIAPIGLIKELRFICGGRAGRHILPSRLGPPAGN